MSDTHVPQGGGQQWSCWSPQDQKEAAMWWTVKIQSDAGETSKQYRTQADTWEQALADVSALFQPETADFDIDISPASPGPAWEWPVNDLGGQDPAPKYGRDENDLDQEV